MEKRKERNLLPEKNLPAPATPGVPPQPAENLLPVIAFALVFMTALVFWQVGSCGFINFDDGLYVTENSHVRQGITRSGLIWAFTTGHASNWHPLTWISHMVDVQLFGLRPTWHHLMNLLFHIANTVLLFFILHRMTKAIWQSAFVAALFALHPLHVESVAWVAERKDVLSAFFFMLTIGAYSLYVEERNFRRYALLLLFFILGLLAKPMVVTLPFVLLLLDYWPLGRFEQSPPGEGPVLRWTVIRPLLVEKVPLFVLAALSCVVTCLVQHHTGAMRTMEILPLGARLSNALVSYAAYMGKMVWPINLAVFYPHPMWWPLWKVIMGAAVLLLFTVLVVRAGRKHPYVLVGWLWYVGTLIPVIGIVQVGSQAMADRYTYIPLVGLFIIVAWGISELLKNLPRQRETLAALSALCLVCLFLLTWRQVSYWHNDITLYTHTLAVTDRNCIIYMNRGVAYGTAGNYRAAIKDITRAIEIDPKIASLYLNLGVAYNGLNDYARGVEAFTKAIEIDQRYAAAYRNRAIAYSVLGDHVKAITDFTKAIEIDPEFAVVYDNRGAVYGAMNDHARAITDFTKAIEIDPEFAAAYRNRAIAYRAMGDHARAIADFSKAIEVDPRYAAAYHNRAVAYRAMGDHARATADFARAAQLDPQFAVHHGANTAGRKYIP
ncbi:MAG: TPR repeat-containing protein YrrB [Syntrophorhabdus sp. PtaB.Bin006]|nr:MAG: TPR repeat-containing protein YrrB [Syntrophorhabdus sp. PtaB.Bin006]